MKRFTSDLINALESNCTTLTKAIIISPRHGGIFRFIDLPNPVTIHGEVFYPAKGISVSSIPYSVNVATTRTDIQIVADDSGVGLDIEQIRNGVFDSAGIKIYVVDWTNPVLWDDEDERENAIFVGNFGEINWDNENKATVECVGLLSQTGGITTEVYTPVCRTDFGDRRCRVPIMGQQPEMNKQYLYGESIRLGYTEGTDPTGHSGLWMCIVPGISGPEYPVPPASEIQSMVWGTAEFQHHGTPWTKTGTVGSVEGGELADRVYIHVDDEPRLTQPGWFRNGQVIFRTGVLAGRAYEIKDSNNQVIHLFLPLELRPANGDKVEIFPGCDHSPSAEWGCKRYNNILNYRGEPWAPSDMVDYRDPDLIDDE